MAIYIEIEPDDFLGHMFNACSQDQISEFIPEKRGFRIHGHSTTIRLERVFWTVLAEITERLHLTMPQLIERVFDGCLVANEKNLASCLRVICMKYMNAYTSAQDAGGSGMGLISPVLRSNVRRSIVSRLVPTLRMKRKPRD